MRCRRTRPNQRRGAHLVEMAFVLLTFMLFLLAVFEYGRFLWCRQMAEDAVREAARAAVVANTNNSTGYNYQTDSTIKALAFFLVSDLKLNNSSGNPLQQSDIIVNQVNPATGTASSGNTNNGNWVNTPFGGSIAVQINAQYVPLFPMWSYWASPIPINVTSMMCNEANNQ